MKNFKIILTAIALLAAGTLAFADSAAEAYLDKFTSLVTTAEACAKNNETSKAPALAAQKEGIDALRKTVTLSLTQRFSDWRLTNRYDAAYTKLKAVEEKDNASESLGKVGEAIGEAAGNVGGAVKDTTTKAVKNAKESVEDTVSTVKDNTKKKVDDTVQSAKDKVDETVTGAAEKASEGIKKGAESFADKLNKLFNGDKSEKKE